MKILLLVTEIYRVNDVDDLIIHGIFWYLFLDMINHVLMLEYLCFDILFDFQTLFDI